MRGFFGHIELGATATIPYTTADANGMSVSKDADGTIRVYKNAGLVQRTSLNGITDTEDFDGVTGCHMLSVDTSDNTDPGFYTTGDMYHIMLEGATIDGVTPINDFFASFAIGQLVGADSTVLSGVSVVSIVNKAMVLIGEPTITSLEDDSNRARLANAIFAQVRDEVYEAHNWTSLRRLATLAQLVATPEWKWAYQYALPADYIRLVSINGKTDLTLFPIHGRNLLSNESTAEIEYIARETDMTSLRPSLRDVISCRLAMELSASLVGTSSDVWQVSKVRYEERLASARHQDSSDLRGRQSNTTRWLNSR